MNYAKITVVTPTYNSSRYLEETILSIINQNYPNLEYIIIDGGSTDSTLEIINKYKSHLAYWISEPDNGMYYAIQKGFEKSSGEIMAWLNSDDKYQRGSLFLVNQIFNNLPDVEWISGMPTYFNKEGYCINVAEWKGWSKSRLWLNDYKWIQQESVFWKRSLWEKAGGFINTSYRLAGDFELWCRFSQVAQMYSIGTVLGGFRIHGDQLSVINAAEYDREGAEVSKSFRPVSSEIFKYCLLKPLYFLKNSFGKSDLKMMKYIAYCLDKIVEFVHHFPPEIRYDYKKDLWIKIYK